MKKDSTMRGYEIILPLKLISMQYFDVRYQIINKLKFINNIDNNMFSNKCFKIITNMSLSFLKHRIYITYNNYNYKVTLFLGHNILIINEL